MNIEALQNTILFRFLDEVSGDKRKFTDRMTPGGIVLSTLDSEQKSPRWGLVKYIGPDVTGIQPGEFIYIEGLMWSFGTEVDGEKLWKTDDSKVLFVTDDPTETYRF